MNDGRCDLGRNVQADQGNDREGGIVRGCAAGLEHRSPYALRHTFAAWSIAAGIGLFELARFMGTSVEQIDRTYGHLLPDSIDRARNALEAFGHLAATEKSDAAEH
jgi:integrase